MPITSDVLCYLPAASDNPNTLGFDPAIYAAGPAGLAAHMRHMAALAPWAGCYVELGRNRALGFSCALWHSPAWSVTEFVRGMGNSAMAFAGNGPRIAYLGIQPGDLGGGILNGLQTWHETIKALLKVGFTHIGVDASSETTPFSYGWHTLKQACASHGMGVLVEGAPSQQRGLLYHEQGFIQTSEQRRGVGHDGDLLTLEMVAGKGLAVCVHNGVGHDPDMDAMLAAPQSRATALACFVGDMRAAGAWPALAPHAMMPNPERYLSRGIPA